MISIGDCTEFEIYVPLLCNMKLVFSMIHHQFSFCTTFFVDYLQQFLRYTRSFDYKLAHTYRNYVSRNKFKYDIQLSMHYLVETGWLGMVEPYHVLEILHSQLPPSNQKRHEESHKGSVPIPSSSILRLGLSRCDCQVKCPEILKLIVEVYSGEMPLMFLRFEANNDKLGDLQHELHRLHGIKESED